VLTIEEIQTKSNWTYADYDLLPEDFYCEILNGELYVSPWPIPKHQLVLLKLYSSLNAFVEKIKLGTLFVAPLDIVLENSNVLQPDIFFVSNSNRSIIKEKSIVWVPDMAIEILSPSGIKKDRVIKMKIYEQFGLPELWLVDPANNSFEIYSLQLGKYNLYSFAAEKGLIQSIVLNGFELDVNSFFEEIPSFNW
jgi:Uma2 family endonuclease